MEPFVDECTATDGVLLDEENLDHPGLVLGGRVAAHNPVLFGIYMHNNNIELGTRQFCIVPRYNIVAQVLSSVKDHKESWLIPLEPKMP